MLERFGVLLVEDVQLLLGLCFILLHLLGNGQLLAAAGTFKLLAWFNAVNTSNNSSSILPGLNTFFEYSKAFLFSLC